MGACDMGMNLRRMSPLPASALSRPVTRAGCLQLKCTVTMEEDVQHCGVAQVEAVHEHIGDVIRWFESHPMRSVTFQGKPVMVRMVFVVQLAPTLLDRLDPRGPWCRRGLGRSWVMAGAMRPDDFNVWRTAEQVRDFAEMGDEVAAALQENGRSEAARSLRGLLDAFEQQENGTRTSRPDLGTHLLHYIRGRKAVEDR